MALALKASKLLLIVSLLSWPMSVALAQPGDLPPEPPELSPPEFPDVSILPSENAGYLDGSSSVTPAGEFRYTIPIEVPSGRAGVQPKLALEYRSRGGDGPLGVGWSVSGLSEIRRCGKTLATEGEVDGIDYDTTDHFCLDGQTLVAVNGTYGADGTEYRTEHDTFARIVSASLANGPTSFRVWDKSGRILDYTMIVTNRVKRTLDYPYPLNPIAKVAPVWLLHDVHDRSGNFMRFQYEIESQDLPPYAVEYNLSTIDYTLSDSGEQAHRSVKFNYEPRPDPNFRYESGVRFRSSKRLTGIELSAPNPIITQVVWSYKLEYEPLSVCIDECEPADTWRSRLASVQRCDADGVCLWAKKFDWEHQRGPAFDTFDLDDHEFPADFSGLGYQTQFHVFDANGDGKDDMLYRIATTSSSNFQGPTYLRLSAGTAYDPKPLSQRIKVNTNSPFFDEFFSDFARPIDYEGDGTVEMFAAFSWPNSPNGSGYQTLRWNTPLERFDAVGSFVPATLDPGGQGVEYADFTDLDGDGLIDMFIRGEANNSSHWFGQLNTGSGFTAETDSGQYYACAGSARGADLNGDGRGELFTLKQGCSQTTAIGLGDDAIFLADPTWEADFDNDAILADVNGDGLKDMFFPEVDLPLIRWNTGNGFGPFEEFPYTEGAGPYGEPFDVIDKGSRVADVNRDGYEDFVLFRTIPDHTLMIYLSGPNALRQGEMGFVSTEIASGPGTLTGDGWSTSKLGDFNGDGLVDIVMLQERRIRVLLQKLSNGDVIHAVRDELAEHPRELVTYSPMWSDAPTTPICQFPQRCIRHGLTVVREHWVSQGEAIGAYRRRQFSYEDPRVDAHGRGFLGFAQVRERDPDLPSETITTFDNQTRIGSIYPYAGLPKTVTHIVPIVEQPPSLPAVFPPGTSARARVIRVSHTYTLRMLNQNRSFYVHPKRWTLDEWEEDATLESDHVQLSGGPNPPILRHRQGDFEYDDYGNPLVTTEATKGGVRRVTKASYDNSTSKWLIGRPTSLEFASGKSGSAMPEPRLTTYTYDANGLLAKAVVEPNHPELRLATTYTRHPDGLVKKMIASVAGELPRRTYFSYDKEHVFVQQAWDDLAQYHALLRHPAFGVPVLAVDPNGVKTLWQYDGFGRVRTQWPAGAPKVQLSYGPDDRIQAGHPRGVAVSRKEEGGREGVTYHDELGRPWERAEKGFDGQWIYTSDRYNIFGSLTLASRPGMGAASVDRTSLVHDTLDRLVEVKQANNATAHFKHDFLESRSWDPEGNESYVTRDLDDRIVKSVDIIDHEVPTTFSYGPFGQVEHVKDANANLTSITFDKLGRRTSLNDPDKGLTTYVYNGFGEIIQETDALAQATAFKHDFTGRLLQRQDADGTTAYNWDQGPNALGKPSGAVSPDGTVTEYRYDPFGRLAATILTVNGDTYAIGTEYDQIGRLKSLLYPEVPGRPRFTVGLSYNSAGYLEQLADLSAANAPIFTVLSRSVDGDLANSSFGNGVSTSRAYDPLTGRLESIAASMVGTGYSIKYSYDLNGNVKTRTDTNQGRAESFDYDELDRLKQWTLAVGPSSLSVDYTYDDIGNLTKIVANGPWLPNGQWQELNSYGANGKPHALTSNNWTGSYVYDARGRQVLGFDREIGYTSFDLPRTVKRGPGITKFSYDGLGARVRKAGRNGTTVYVGGLYERRVEANSTTHIFYVRTELGPVAQLLYDEAAATGQWRYLQGDALGSVAVASDSAGHEADRFFFDPFGRRIKTDGQIPYPTEGSVRVGFTGHRHDEDLALIDMRGRVYDPSLRRFLTPDPEVSSPLFGQSYNRYSYVLNNPLRFVDRTGYQFEGEQPCTGLCLSLPEPGLKSKGSTTPPPAQDQPSQPSQIKSDPDGYRPPTGALLPTKAAVGEPGPDDAGSSGGAVDTPEPAGVGGEAAAEASWKENSIVQYVAGFVTGFGLGVVPFGGVVDLSLSATKLQAEGTREAQIGKAIGGIVGGSIATIAGVGGEVIGLGLSATGVGALVGAPAAVASATVVVGGAGNVAAGLAGLQHALSTGSGTRGGGGRNRNAPADVLDKGEGLNPDRSVRRVGGKQGMVRGTESLRAGNRDIIRVYEDLQLTLDEQKILHSKVHYDNLDYEELLEVGLSIWPEKAALVGR